MTYFCLWVSFTLKRQKDQHDEKKTQSLWRHVSKKESKILPKLKRRIVLGFETVSGLFNMIIYINKIALPVNNTDRRNSVSIKSSAFQFKDK